MAHVGVASAYVTGHRVHTLEATLSVSAASLALLNSEHQTLAYLVSFILLMPLNSTDYLFGQKKYNVIVGMGHTPCLKFMF